MLAVEWLVKQVMVVNLHAIVNIALAYILGDGMTVLSRQS